MDIINKKLLLLWAFMLMDDVVQGSNSSSLSNKITLRKCCGIDSLLHVSPYYTCEPRSKFNASSWDYGTNLNIKYELDFVVESLPVCFTSLEKVIGEIDINEVGEIGIGDYIYDNERFCLDQMVSNSSELLDVTLYCPWKPFNASGISNETYKIPQCCPPFEAYDSEYYCVPSQHYLRPRFYNSLTGRPIDPSHINYTLIKHQDHFCGNDSDIIFNNDRFHLIQNGHLYLLHRAESYPPSKFCIEHVISPDGERIDRMVAVVCVPKKKTIWKDEAFCKDHVCVQKCCAEGKAVFKAYKCEEYGDPFVPVFHNQFGYPLSPPDEYNVTSQLPICRDGGPPIPFNLDNLQEELFVLPDGRIYSVEQGAYFSSPEYCIDTLFNQTHSSLFGLFCATYSHKDVDPVVATLHTLGMITSAIFLVLTLIVYLIVPDLRNLHGRTLMCFVGTMLLAFILLIQEKLYKARRSNLTCKGLAYLLHFSLLSSFFWMNVMNFDICSMMTKGVKNERKNKRFKRYCLYAWGVPLLMGAIVTALDNVKNLPYYIVRPRIGYELCWLHNGLAVFVYFYGPIAILLFFNILFFGVTVYQIFKANRDTTVVQNSAQTKKRLFVYLKLFFLMGTVWIMEIVSWALQPTDYVWLVTDMVNILQGLFIFIIFVCKKKTLRKVKASLRHHFVTCSKRCGRSRPYEAGVTDSRRSNSSTFTTTSSWRTNTDTQMLEVSDLSRIAIANSRKLSREK